MFVRSLLRRDSGGTPNCKKSLNFGPTGIIILLRLWGWQSQLELSNWKEYRGTWRRWWSRSNKIRKYQGQQNILTQQIERTICLAPRFVYPSTKLLTSCSSPQTLPVILLALQLCLPFSSPAWDSQLLKILTPFLCLLGSFPLALGPLDWEDSSLHHGVCFIMSVTWGILVSGRGALDLEMCACRPHVSLCHSGQGEGGQGCLGSVV